MAGGFPGFGSFKLPQDEVGPPRMKRDVDIENDRVVWSDGITGAVLGYSYEAGDDGPTHPPDEKDTKRAMLDHGDASKAYAGVESVKWGDVLHGRATDLTSKAEKKGKRSERSPTGKSAPRAEDKAVADAAIRRELTAYQRTGLTRWPSPLRQQLLDLGAIELVRGEDQLWQGDRITERGLSILASIPA